MKTRYKHGLILVLALLLAKIAHGQQLAASGNPALTNQPVVFSVQITSQTTVTATPTGSITFSDAGQNIGTAPLQPDASASFTAVFTTTGDHAIVASYSGDQNFGPSQTTPLVEHINTTDAFSLAATPAVVNQSKGDISPVTVTLFAPSSSANAPVTLSCDQLPPGVTCSFQANQLVPTTAPGATTLLSLQSTPPTRQAGILPTPPFYAGLTVLVLAFLLLRSPITTRNPRYTLATLSLCCLIVLLAGCGGSTRIRTSTPSGTSTIRVVATDGTLTQVSNITLTVK